MNLRTFCRVIFARPSETLAISRSQKKWELEHKIRNNYNFIPSLPYHPREGLYGAQIGKFLSQLCVSEFELAMQKQPLKNHFRHQLSVSSPWVLGWRPELPGPTASFTNDTWHSVRKPTKKHTPKSTFWLKQLWPENPKKFKTGLPERKGYTILKSFAMAIFLVKGCCRPHYQPGVLS